MTKTELMMAVQTGRHHESFVHTIYGAFDITLMREAAKDVAELVDVPLYAIIDFIRAQRVTEEDRICSLDEASWSEDPGISFWTEDGLFMIDGHHRALRREREGRTHMKMWLFPQELVIRPLPGFVQLNDLWGDKIVDGKIIRGSGG